VTVFAAIGSSPILVAGYENSWDSVTFWDE
jgi:hypothetical protein